MQTLNAKETLMHSLAAVYAMHEQPDNATQVIFCLDYRVSWDESLPGHLLSLLFKHISKTTNSLGAMCIFLNKQKSMYNIFTPSITALYKFLWRLCAYNYNMPTAGKGIMEMKLCTKIVIRDPACKSILIRKQICLQ